MNSSACGKFTDDADASAKCSSEAVASAKTLPESLFSKAVCAAAADDDAAAEATASAASATSRATFSFCASFWGEPYAKSLPDENSRHVREFDGPIVMCSALRTPQACGLICTSSCDPLYAYKPRLRAHLKKGIEESTKVHMSNQPTNEVPRTSATASDQRH